MQALLTGAFSAVLPPAGGGQAAVEGFLPELGEPDVPAVVLQGSRSEVPIKGCRHKAQLPVR